MAEDVVALAETLLARAELRVREEDAAARLRRTTGLRLAPLWPPSEVLQVVTLDGVHIGRVRREYPHSEPARWVAVPIGARRRGPYRSAAAAAQALVGLAGAGPRHPAPPEHPHPSSGEERT